MMRGRRFEDITAATGTGHLQKGHGVAFADWDRDGDADIFEAGGAVPGRSGPQCFVSEPGKRQPLAHDQAGRLPGPTEQPSVPRSGWNCRARPAQSRRATRNITSGSSFAAPPQLHDWPGGQATAISAVEVTWPTTRTRQTFEVRPSTSSSRSSRDDRTSAFSMPSRS